MKIDTGANYLYAASQRALVGNQAVQDGNPSSFAAALAEKTQLTGNAGFAQASQTVKKYDFTNMTPQEMQGVMNDLVRSGQISLDETSSLSSMIPSPLSKVNYDGQMPETFTQSWNFLSRIQEGIESALSRNEKESANSLNRSLQALTRFQGQAVGVNVYG